MKDVLLKTIKALLTLMLITLKESTYEINGLCELALHLYWQEKITIEEYNILNNYIEKYRPNKWCHYSWASGKKEPRIEWLEEQIKKL